MGFPTFWASTVKRSKPHTPGPGVRKLQPWPRHAVQRQSQPDLGVPLSSLGVQGFL